MQIGKDNLANAATYKLPESDAPKPDEVEKVEKQDEQTEKPETPAPQDLENLAKNNNEIEQNTENTNKSHSIHDSIKDLVSKKLLKFTTAASVVVNLISAPVRLYDDENPLKKIINHISMIATKSHLLTYAASGLNNAIKDKNPFLLFSFAIEGLSAMFGIRKIYLFRGIASGVDGAIAGVQNRYKEQGKAASHDNFVDSFKDYFGEIKNITKEFFADPLQTLFRNDGVHKGIMSSWLMILGSFFGLTVNDSIGAGFRDGAGAINDYSLIEYESKTAKTSGAFYLSGSIFDFAAHLFGMNDKYKPFRNVFHEVAIALDRVGQYLFLRCLEESDEKPEKVKDVQKAKEPKKDLHQATNLNAQMAV